MAISIDRVYQKVLVLANKEQRGYITPQEFNLLADHAQMEIFEQYFYDLNQFQRLPGQDHEYSDPVTILKSKIELFERWQHGGYNITVSNKWGDCGSIASDIPDMYRLGEVSVSYNINGKLYPQKVAEQLTPREYTMRSGSIVKPSYDRPVYVKYSSTSLTNRIKIYPYPRTYGNATDVNGNKVPDGTIINGENGLASGTKQAGVSADFIRKPIKPNWAYVVVNNKPLYNSTSSVDFELHDSEETELVYRILAMVGVSIEKPQITQLAGQALAGQIQQEKS